MFISLQVPRINTVKLNEKAIKRLVKLLNIGPEGQISEVEFTSNLRYLAAMLALYQRNEVEMKKYHHNTGLCSFSSLGSRAIYGIEPPDLDVYVPGRPRQMTFEYAIVPLLMAKVWRSSPYAHFTGWIGNKGGYTPLRMSMAKRMLKVLCDEVDGIVYDTINGINASFII